MANRNQQAIKRKERKRQRKEGIQKNRQEQISGNHNIVDYVELSRTSFDNTRYSMPTSDDIGDNLAKIVRKIPLLKKAGDYLSISTNRVFKPHVYMTLPEAEEYVHRLKEEGYDIGKGDAEYGYRMPLPARDKPRELIIFKRK